MFFQSNANTSKHILSRDQRNAIRQMCVKPKPPGQRGNSTAICWRYFGQLCDADGKLLDEARLYCSLCLYAEQQLLLLLLLSVIVHKAQYTTRVTTNKKHAMLCIKKEG